MNQNKIPAEAGIQKLWYIYIMSNKPQGVIYIGVTDN